MRSLLRILSWAVLCITGLAFTAMLANAGQPMPTTSVAHDIVVALVMAALFGGQAAVTLLLLDRTGRQTITAECAGSPRSGGDERLRSEDSAGVHGAGPMLPPA
jgi:hypothetical protein